MNDKIESIFQKEKVGIGKRKQAIARVFLVPGTGNIIINNNPGEKYLQYNLSYLNDIWAPLKILNLEKQFDIITIVKGGGITVADQLRITANITSNTNPISANIERVDGTAQELETKILGK